MVDVTARSSQVDLLRGQTGGVVGGREGRVTVRGTSLDPLPLAEATLRVLRPAR